MAQLDYVSSRYSTYRKREVEGCDEEQCLFRMSDTKPSRRIQRSLPSATLELDISVPRPGTSGRPQRHASTSEILTHEKITDLGEPGLSGLG